MTVFIAIATLLTLLALAWLVRPLLWPVKATGVSSQGLNASIYRDQIEGLERDLARGAISAAECELVATNCNCVCSTTPKVWRMHRPGTLTIS